MRARLTRRQVGILFAGSAVPLAGRAPSPEQEDSPEKLLDQAKADIRRDGGRLHDFRLPMAEEPAFLFKP